MSKAKLNRSLGLIDVYAISTGAMFSSGFFLLPGLAAANTGSSVVLAYLVAGLLIIPAMFSIAELSTALPRSGGAYYFLDRSMGPLMGSIGGLGSWMALVFKSGFALIGMGAYITVFWDGFPIKPLAIACTVLFTVVNVFGAKKSGTLQRRLVYVLLGVLTFFIADGLYEVFAGEGGVTRLADQPFALNGFSGFAATIGMVFVSYAGLTNVCSVSEEIKDPDRNIPLGMFLSLATATTFYVVGVAIMATVLEQGEFYKDLTPVATAAATFLDVIPYGVALVVIAAIAAFASTGNAGIMAASRYPMAMGRDRLLPSVFANVGRFGTPTLAIVTTGAIIIVLIVTLDIESVAKLASAFQLLLFGLLCLAVLVMREAKIDYYRPGFMTPFYPWTQIAGLLIPIWLIYEMGLTAVLFTVGVILACIAWYFFYARGKVERGGAIFHVFERWGRQVYRGLHHEFRSIVDEKGLDEDDPFEQVVAQARVLDIEGQPDFEHVVRMALENIDANVEEALDIEAELARIIDELRIGTVPVASGAIVPHLRLEGIEHSHMVMVRVEDGVELKEGDPIEGRVFAVIVLVSPKNRAGQHYRILARIAGRIDDSDFVPEWLVDKTEADFKETLLRDDRYIQIHIEDNDRCAHLIGSTVKDADFPTGALVALIRRGGHTLVPGGETTFEAGDWLTVIGDPEAISALHIRYWEGVESDVPQKFVEDETPRDRD